MQKWQWALYILCLPALILGSVTPQAHAANPTFTISATNVTMSSSGSSGTGASTFTLTSLNGYTGTIGINCYPTTEQAGATVPFCGGSAMIGHTLSANQVVTGQLPFYNVPVPEPVRLPLRRSHAGLTRLALAAMIFCGLGLRKRIPRALYLALLAAALFAGLGTMSACGGSKSAVTPGTYSYTVKALDTNSNIVTATFQVTVP